MLSGAVTNEHMSRSNQAGWLAWLCPACVKLPERCGLGASDLWYKDDASQGGLCRPALDCDLIRCHSC